MRVISKARLKQFWESPNQEDAEGPLQAWYTHVSNKTVSWHCWGDVKASFGNASSVGNCVVFNIKGGDYRLITRVLYVSQKVFVLKVMPHDEYDKNRRKEQCGCFTPPPVPKVKARDTAPKQQRKGR
jgi:mRNA interferase HigB